jgi:hypothetical protein
MVYGRLLIAADAAKGCDLHVQHRAGGDGGQGCLQLKKAR